MAKKFYCDYVDHCIRYYIRYPQGDKNFVSEISQDNWSACDKVLSKNKTNMDMIRIIFGNNGTIADGVEDCARQYNMEPTSVYSVLRSIEYEIAKARGLV